MYIKVYKFCTYITANPIIIMDKFSLLTKPYHSVYIHSPYIT